MAPCPKISNSICNLSHDSLHVTKNVIAMHPTSTKRISERTPGEETVPVLFQPFFVVLLGWCYVFVR